MKIKRIKIHSLSNRIVIDYGNTNALVLLGIIDTETGEDLPLVDMGFGMVERYDGIKDFDKLKALELDNKEGFVIKYSNGFRMKIKFDEYCRLHRIITNITSYDIWDCLKNGTGFDEVLDKVPDEFYEWVKVCKNNLIETFDVLKIKILETYLQGCEIEDQKEFALWVKNNHQHYSKYLFNLRNGLSIDDLIWKNIKPEYEKPYS